MRAHITEGIKASLRSKNTLLSVIPAGCTRLCQPADVSWNAPFKAAFRNHYSEWLSEGNLERTERGNLRPISKSVLVEFTEGMGYCHGTSDTIIFSILRDNSL